MFYILDPELSGLEATTLFNMSTLPLYRCSYRPYLVSSEL